MSHKFFDVPHACRAVWHCAQGVVSQAKSHLRQTRFLTRRGREGKRGSLVRRFQALLLVWGLIIYALAVGGFWFTSNHIMESAFSERSKEWIGRLGEMATASYTPELAGDFSELDNYASHYDEIAYIRVYNVKDLSLAYQYYAGGLKPEEGMPAFSAQLFHQYTRRQLANRLSTIDTLESHKHMFRVLAPVIAREVNPIDMIKVDQPLAVRLDPNVLGYIEIGVDYGSYKEKLVENIVAGTIVISFIFLMAAFVGRQLITSALKPLLDLQEPLHRLAKGETDVWVSREGDEEIAAISKALNSTIRAIKGRDEELRRLADYDALTGLINKRSFSVLLEKERQRVIHDNDSSALFFIDLDQFKYVNDTLGHSAGDRLLVQIAELLQSRMRSDDVVCRLGGDEFAVLAKAVDKDGAIEIANAIVKSMYDFLFVEQGKTFNIYCSVGVALLENDAYTADDIFSNADMACYTAKSQGRNRFKIFEPQIVDRNKVDIGWSHRIAHALSHDNFVLHYQPIVGFDANEAPSFEVLLRMKGEDGEIIPPYMFIPVAERFGLATEIDYWVIRNSMKILERMNAEGSRARFYVNLSGQLLVDPDFVSRVLDMFDQTAIDASQIVFELTERAAVGNIHAASDKMRTLREHGFLFAVDDFGSGFSSFSYLKHMPVEFVKIEGEFVERIIDDEVDRALVKSMVDIAKACGKQVVAEYVGDQKTLDLLKSYGIDYAQGFFIATPAAEPAFGLLFDQLEP